MTFEEIKDMINSTITENGQRHITGKSINLAFIETLTAIEEFLENNKPKGGAASEIVYFPDMTTGEMDPEHQAHNLEVYNKFKTAFEEGKPLPLLSLDLSFVFAQVEDQLGMPANVSGYLQCNMVVFIPVDSPMAAQSGDGIMFIYMEPGSGSIPMSGLIQSDGNIMLTQ